MYAKKFLDRTTCLQTLREFRCRDLADCIERLCSRRFTKEHHGNLGVWENAWTMLPDLPAVFDSSGDAVKVIAEDVGWSLDSRALDSLKQTLMQFHPWRKGPLELLGVAIDTEWRSNLKWNRFANHIDFHRKRVLDVGCGNGYYGWKMLDAGAALVVGCEPFLLSVAQFEVFRKFWSQPERLFVVPLADTDLPKNMQRFDITCSMGVLYHRPNPIEHLQILYGSLAVGGTLLLETIVLPDDVPTVLVPEDRYAKMRNVWFLPSVPMLVRWLKRCGFVGTKLLDLSPTTVEEQRRTPWMTFESLENFLHPHDQSKTIEGYPAPYRAVVTAVKA